MLLEIVTFICGAAVMVFELAGMRIITPFLGSSFIVWICTIGIIMTSLSLGYYIGGKISDKNPTNTKLSFFITFASLYILIVAITGFKFLEYITSGIFLNLYISSIYTALYIFTIPSILLGIVSPYTIKLALADNNSTETGTVIGKFYAISTIGSIIGTFLSGFFLIIFFGIDTILFALSSMLVISSLFLIINKLNNRVNLILIVFQILILIFSFFFIFYYKLTNKQIFNNVIYSKSTPYQYLCIRKTYDPEFKRNILCLNSIKGSCQSSKIENDLKNELVFAYIRLFYKFYDIKKQKNNILMFGGAGNALTTKILYNSDNNLKFDVIEIDRETKILAHKYFNLPEDKRLNFYFEDARTFINRESKRYKKNYDIVYLDVYREDNIPFNLLTIECFANIKKLMAKNSILCVNISINNDKLSGDEYLNQIYTQIKSVFPEVVCYSEYKIEKKYKMYNIIIVAYNNPNSDDSIKIKQIMKEFEYKNVNISNSIFTDKYAPIEKFEIYKSNN